MSKWAVNGLLVAVIFVLGVYVSRQDAHRRADRRVSFQHADVVNCKGLNKLRAALRDKENENYSHRYRDLKLLHIKPTPRVLLIINLQHLKQLERLKATDCKHLSSGGS